MTWTIPQYSRREVNEAGAVLARIPLFVGDDGQIDEDYASKLDRAVDTVSNFRLSHAFPLNTMQNGLRKRAQSVDAHGIVAQRLKRLSSITAKLFRFETMKLWEMQDIGGCRAIVQTVANVNELVELFKKSGMRHRLTHEDDYIEQPRSSGYRGRHLIYRYYSDRNEKYNGMKVEVQIRTRLQHAWATTVETVDAFTQQALKSSRGRRDWERFFQLMGTEMAFREGTTPVSGTPTSEADLLGELRLCANSLRVKARLEGFTAALKATQTRPVRSAQYYLLSLDTVAERLSITGYERGALPQASKDYSETEKGIRDKPGADAVLVSVDSIANLQRAYPNYYADTRAFVDELDRSLGDDPTV